MPNPLRVGVVGLGFMGRTHVQAFLSAENAGYHSRLVAIADTKAKDLSDNASGGNIKVNAGEVPVDPKKVKMSPNAAGLVADASVEAVSICTPTDTHVGLVIAALAGGKHVLVEKPLALLAEDVLRVHKAASKADRVCMPAMVMRFWPGWEWLHDRVKDRSLGACRSVEFERRGSRPTWNTAFYGDANRSGGALLDLHIHDSDFVLWTFGRPEAVTTVGSLDQLTTVYHYPKGSGAPEIVVASGGWGQHAGFGFRMRYIANFEKATADFDLSRGDRPVMLSDAHESKAVELPTTTGYEAEVRHFVEIVTKGVTPRATVQDALDVTCLLDAERRSIETGRTVSVEYIDPAEEAGEDPWN
jgi:predicted dehydrogenase